MNFLTFIIAPLLFLHGTMMVKSAPVAQSSILDLDADLLDGNTISLPISVVVGE